MTQNYGGIAATETFAGRNQTYQISIYLRKLFWFAKTLDTLRFWTTGKH